MGVRTPFKKLHRILSLSQLTSCVQVQHSFMPDLARSLEWCVNTTTCEAPSVLVTSPPVPLLTPPA
jgi:hypothetical protein